MHPRVPFTVRAYPLMLLLLAALVALGLFIGGADRASALYSDDVYVTLSDGTRFEEPSRLWNSYFCSLKEICMLADVNRDGRDDAVAFMRSNGSATDSDVWVALARSTGDGFGPPRRWSQFFCTAEEICATGDVNGDNRHDLISFVRTNHDTNDSDVWVALARSFGNGFGPPQRWHDYFCTREEICKVGDVDADGDDDIIAFARTTNLDNDSDVYVALSNRAGFGPGQKWHDHFCTLQEICEVGDLDDDGDDDIVAFVRSSTGGPNDGDVWIARSTGTGFSPSQKWHESFCTGQQICAVGDVTGEGFADAVAFENGTDDGDIEVAINLGFGFDPAPKKWADYHCVFGDVCALGDVNRDEREDAVAFTRTRQPGPPQPVSMDVIVSLYRSVTPAERYPYEEIFRHFADAIFEMTNGAHRVTSVTVYQNGTIQTDAHVVWTASVWPSAPLSGRTWYLSREGSRQSLPWNAQTIKMGDSFPFSITNPYNALRAGNERGAGYTLAHEFGHYWYGLADEYQGGSPCVIWNDPAEPQFCDVAVPSSVMNWQWGAAAGNNFQWLNFSIPANQTTRNANLRVYGASGWEVLRRPPADDPKDGLRQNYPSRIHYPELATVAPTGNQAPTLEMPVSEGRSDLQIIWRDSFGTARAAGDATEYLATVSALVEGEVRYPESVPLVATLEKEGEPIARAEVSATVTVDDVTVPLAFRDDGIAPDGKADDGVYSAMLPYQENGNHHVVVTFRNTSGQAAFTYRHRHYTPGPNGEVFDPQPQLVGEPFEQSAGTTIEISDHPGADPGPHPPAPITTDNTDYPGRIDAAGDVERFTFTGTGGQIVARVTDRALGMEPVLRVFAGNPPELVAEQAGPAPGVAYPFVRLNAEAGIPYLIEVTHADPNAGEGFFNVSAGPAIASDGTAGGPQRLFLSLLQRDRGWWSGIQLQNLGTSTASVSIQVYPRTGTPPAPYTIEGGIPAGGHRTLTPIQLGLPENFEGSAVVDSDQPLNAVTNISNQFSSGGQLGTRQGRAAGLYQGTGSTVAATELNFPLVKNDLFGRSTTFYIQNAGTGDATATATYRVAGGTFTQDVTIPEGRTVVLLPGDARVPTGNGSLGSLTVSSTSGQALAGVSLEYIANETTATLVQATRGLTPADRDARAYAPIIKNTFGDRFTGLQIQNAGDTPVDVTVRYVGSSAGGSSCGGMAIENDVVEDLQPGASHTFVHLPDAAPERRSKVPANCLASATIEATGGSIVAIVNEGYVRSLVGSDKHPYDAGTTSFAIPVRSATRWVSAPLYKENAFSKTTGLQVQNAGDGPASNVVATFTCGGGGGTEQRTYQSEQQSIPAGGSFTFVTMWRKPDQMATDIPSETSGFAGVCSVIVTADQPIVAVANESSYPFFDFPETENTLEQDNNNYEAFNLAAAPYSD